MNDEQERKVTDAERLKGLYEERVPRGMSQEKFGELYGIGTKAMVWQYLTGYRPLNFEAAAKFAKGLRCTIRDISPDLADTLESDIMPMLGARALKRAMAKMMIAVVAALFTIPPSPAEAAFNKTLIMSLTECTLRVKRWLRRWWPAEQS